MSTRPKVGDSYGPGGDDGSKGESGHVVSSETVISCCDAPPVLELAEQSLDDVASSVGLSIDWIGCRPGSSGRDDRFDTSLLEPVAKALGVISLVGNETLRRCNGRHDRLGHRDIGDVSWCQGEGDRSATIIGQSMDLARPAAARAPDRLALFPPFPPAAERCALTCELSRQSSSGMGPEAAIFSNRLAQTPRADHLL
jgi:hypothetical protein